MDSSKDELNDDEHVNRWLMQLGNEKQPKIMKEKDVEWCMEPGADVNTRDNDGNTPLHVATEQQDVTLVKRLLEHGASVDAIDDNGDTPLHNMVSCKKESTFDLINNFLEYGSGLKSNNETSLNIIEQLLNAGADVNATNKNGCTPLHLATFYKDLCTVEMLLKCNTDLSITNGNGETLLHLAVTRGNAELVELILKNGADKKTPNKAGDMPLHIAAYFGTVSVAEVLLISGVDANTTNKRGYTALHLAVIQYKTPAMVKLLLKYGADVSIANESGDTVLYLAPHFGDDTLVELLIKFGAYVKNKNKAGSTPLHSAALNGSRSIIELLIESGADVNTTNEAGRTPLYHAACRLEARTVELLLKYGANVNITDRRGKTPLYMAEHVEVVECLLKHVHGVDTKNSKGNTPLQAAVRCGNISKVDLLLKYSADVNTVNDDGNTPLHIAADKGNKPMIKLLLSFRADVNIANKDGDTPLHLATRSQKGSAVKFLLKSNVKVSIKNKYGNTPFHEAVLHEEAPVVELFLRFGSDVNSINKAGNTPLHIAARRKHSKITKLLLLHDADVTLRNLDSDTALTVARVFNFEDYEEVTSLLETAERIARNNVSPNEDRSQNSLCHHESSIHDFLKNRKPEYNYLKRAGTSGLSGQLYETKFLSLILIRILNDNHIEYFFLGTNAHGIGDMDDICLRYRVRGQDKPVVLFVQAKHRENPEKGKISIENLRSNSGEFSLRKYLGSYHMIRDRFEADNEDPMFEGDFDNVECYFIIYTPVKDCLIKKKKQLELEAKIHNLLGTGHVTDVFQLDPEEDNINYLTKITAIERLTTFGMVFLKFILSETNKSEEMMANYLIARHHVVMGREVLQHCKIQQENKGYRIWKFRAEFFGSDCEYLLALKNKFIKEISTKCCHKSEITNEDRENFKQALRDPCASTISKVIGKFVTYNYKSNRLQFLEISADKELLKNYEIKDFNKIVIPENIIHDAVQMKLMALDIKLPMAFGNLDMAFHENKNNVQSVIKLLSDRLINLLEVNKKTKIIEINNDFMERDESIDTNIIDINGIIGSAVGNLLVKDMKTQMLKFDLDNNTLPHNATLLLKELTDARHKPINDELCSYRIKINAGFPKDSLYGDQYDKKLAKDFIRKFWFFTNQSNENKVEQILKNHINTYYNYEKRANKFLFDVHCNAIFLKSHDDLQKWWMQKGEASYLTRANDVFRHAKLACMNNLLLTVIDHLHHFNIFCMDINFNRRINQNETGIEVPEDFHKIFGKLFNVFDTHNKTISISMESKNDIVSLLRTAERLMKGNVSSIGDQSDTCINSQVLETFKYLKRAGTSGVSGQLLETKLLSLVHIRALKNNQIDHFLLGNSIRGIGDFDDICIRYRVKGQKRPVALFVQAKHKENRKTGKLSEEDMRSTSGNFCFRKYLKSYLMIRDQFQTNNDDPIFEGDFVDVECNLIIYTSVKNCFHKKKDKELSNHAYYLINTGHKKDVFQYDHGEDDIDYFTKITISEQLKNFAKVFLDFIMSEKDKFDLMLLSKIIVRHHVIVGREVLQQYTSMEQNKTYGIWKFRPDFFNSECEYLSALKCAFIREFYTKRCDKSEITNEDRENFNQVLRDPCASAFSKIIGKLVTYNNNSNQLQFVEAFKSKCRQEEFKTYQDRLIKITIHENLINEAVQIKLTALVIKLPLAFGNSDMTFRGSEAKVLKRMKALANKITKLFENTMTVEINDDLMVSGKRVERGIIDMCGGIGGAVGNLLVEDTKNKALKFDLENKALPHNSGLFLNHLKEASHNAVNKDLSSYRMKINVDGFPIASFTADEYDKQLTRDFLNQLWLFTDQAKEDEVEQIVIDEINKYNKNEISQKTTISNAISLYIHDDIQKWWLQVGTSPYLTRASDLFERAELSDTNNLLLTAINYMYISRIYSIDINVKQRVTDYFEFVPMHKTFNKISCRLFNIFDSEFDKAIDIELPIEVINIHGKFDFSCDLVFCLEIHPEMEWVALKFFAQWALPHGGVSYFLIAKAGPGRGRRAKDGFILRRHFLGRPHNFIEGGKDPLDPIFELGWEYRSRMMLL